MTNKRHQSPEQKYNSASKRAKISNGTSSDGDEEVYGNTGTGRLRLRLTLPETETLLKGLSALGEDAAATDDSRRDRYKQVESVLDQLKAKLADACDAFRSLSDTQDNSAESKDLTADEKESGVKAATKVKKKEEDPEWYIEDMTTKYVPIYRSSVFAPIPHYQSDEDIETANTNTTTKDDTQHDTSTTITTPPLPPIKDPLLETATFQHPGSISTTISPSKNSTPQTYERLEFLGDAYIEIISTRLIYARFPHRTAGQQAQIRELLVKNERLAEFARKYGFDGRVSVHRDGTANVNNNSHNHNGSNSSSSNNKKMKKNNTTSVTNTSGPVLNGTNGPQSHIHTQSPKPQGFTPKHWTKVLADVFEAYIAALILSNPTTGFATAESWLTRLWTPHLPSFTFPCSAGAGEGFLDTKSQLARKLLSSSSSFSTSLAYRETKPMALNRATGRQVYSIGVFFSSSGGGGGGHDDDDDGGDGAGGAGGGHDDDDDHDDDDGDDGGGGGHDDGGRYVDYLLGRGQGQSKVQAGMSAAADALRGNMDVFEWVEEIRARAKNKRSVEDKNGKDRKKKKKTKKTKKSGEEDGMDEGEGDGDMLRKMGGRGGDGGTAAAAAAATSNTADITAIAQ